MTDEIALNSWRRNPFRWALGISASVLLFLALFPAQWVYWGAGWGEHSFCDPSSLSGITTHRSDEFSSYQPTAAEDAGIRIFPPGRNCRLYGVPADYSGPTDSSNAVVIAEAATPESSSYIFYLLIVLFPLGINWLVLRAWRAGHGGE